MTDLTCVISLHNVQGWTLDSTMLGAVMKRVAGLAPACNVIDIYPQERSPLDAPAWKHPGYLEWTMRLHYHGGLWITMGCIQREPGAEIEFHT